LLISISLPIFYLSLGFTKYTLVFVSSAVVPHFHMLVEQYLDISEMA